MEKSKSYQNAYFSTEVLKEAFNEGFAPYQEEEIQIRLRLERGNEEWRYDEESEFYADYRTNHKNSSISKSVRGLEIGIRYSMSNTTITIQAKTRGEIENLFDIFEKNYETSIVEPVKEEKKQPIIFIGHGQSTQWRDLKDHLVDKHEYKIEAYETGARAGHTIRDILNEMAIKSSLALLVMTGEDLADDGTFRARQNVIHEVGLFQGSLGFSKAIVLLEEGTEEFSNMFGIQQIRYSKENIKETFGEVLATIKREFKI